jgi:putative addiction module killer protein
MYEIVFTAEFDKWLNDLRDSMTKRRLARRLEKVSNGNIGDIKHVGENVYEMREFFGNGWRMYYIQQGDVIIVMLGGGDKSTQQSDIIKAIALSKQFED